MNYERIQVESSNLPDHLSYALNQAEMLHKWMVEQGLLEDVTAEITWELGEETKFTYDYFTVKEGNFSLGLYYPIDAEPSSILKSLEFSTTPWQLASVAEYNAKHQMNGRPIFARLSNDERAPIAILQANGDFESTLSWDLLFSPLIRPKVMELIWKKHSVVATQRLIAEINSGVSWDNWEELLQKYFDYLTESVAHDAIFQYANLIYATSTDITFTYDKEAMSEQLDFHTHLSHTNTNESLDFFLDYVGEAIYELSIQDNPNAQQAIESINKALRFIAAGAGGSIAEDSPLREISLGADDLVGNKNIVPQEHREYMNELRERNKQNVQEYYAVWAELRSLPTTGIPFIYRGGHNLNANNGKSVYCPVLPHSDEIPDHHHIFHLLAGAMVKKYIREA